MKIEDLAETYVLSFYLEQRHSYFLTKLIDYDGTRFELLATNSDGSPIGFEVGELRFAGNFTTRENVPSLGELEGAATTEDGAILEGDFGDIRIRANNITIKRES
ncbi:MULTISPECIES: hypothetical protein [unclassified Janthinobacterium]|uniref:hypothetical protein n=1 Tax=unclassified Janthinobacterium TaxID=2610881 RepID=UPI0027144489|nr:MULTISPECIES: hypothetical protein [unclassified Janthinobacterium]MDO8065114.1 hypothetical protein [Janthinobacterium sp. SUN206]MDO8071467.1 hypothetical protein [Janthinobacterium sp. SUN176]